MNVVQIDIYKLNYHILIIRSRSRAIYTVYSRSNEPREMIEFKKKKQQACQWQYQTNENKPHMHMHIQPTHNKGAPRTPPSLHKQARDDQLVSFNPLNTMI